jgi:hypothetical protein
MAFTMACPNFKKGLKMVSGPLGIKELASFSLSSQIFSKGLFTLEKVGSSLKAQVVLRLENEGHWKLGSSPKIRKIEMGCGSNFRCNLKKKGHGPLSRWADFFKWSYPYGLYLELPCSH